MTEGAATSVVTTGSFDGVHLGHQAILAFLVERARLRHARPVVVSFDPHPREVVFGETIPLLTTPAERSSLMAGFGIDETVVLAFDKHLASMPAEDFVREILLERVGASCIVIGHDHGFGAGRRGNRALLEAMGPEEGFDVEVIPALQVGTKTVSSTAIRIALASGDVREAASLLGRAYSWEGRVVPGDQRGRLIGFPTANLDPVEARKIIPKPGVFAVAVVLPDGRRVGGMMNIGIRPTFSGSEMRQEVHLLDFEGDLYGSLLTVEFRERLRDERRFDGIDALVGQLKEDEKRCRYLLEGLV